MRFYARATVLVQPSGLDNSRFVRQLAKVVPAYSFTLGEVPDEIVTRLVPQPDQDVCVFFKEASKVWPGHTVFASFLSAFFRQMLIMIAIVHKKKADKVPSFPALTLWHLRHCLTIP
jgi:hypothetical protein